MRRFLSRNIGWVLLVASTGLAGGCSDDDADDTETTGSGATDDDAGPSKSDAGEVPGELPDGCEHMVNDADCDKSLIFMEKHVPSAGCSRSDACAATSYILPTTPQRRQPREHVRYATSANA